MPVMILGGKPVETWCEDCRKAEQSPLQAFLDRFRYPGDSTARIIRDMGQAMAASIRASHGEVSTSAYDRHIADFVRAGRELNLVRALRHVELEL